MPNSPSATAFKPLFLVTTKMAESFEGKKAIFLAVFGLCSLSCLGQEGNVFQHFSLSGGLGSTGLTIDAGTMMTDHFGLRGGVDLLGIHFHDGEYYQDFNKKLYLLDSDLEPLPGQDADPHLTNSSGHLLLDFYPFKPSKSGFHVTVGAYLAWHRQVESLITGLGERLPTSTLAVVTMLTSQQKWALRRSGIMAIWFPPVPKDRLVPTC